MNTTNILLGTTSLLLVVAFVLSFGNFNKGRSDDSTKKQYAEIRAEIAAQEALINKIELENLRSRAGVPSIAASTMPVATESSVGDPIGDDLKSKLERKIAELEVENSDLSIEKDKAELQADVNEAETMLLMREKTKQAQRQMRDAQRVTQALLMGTVDGFNKEFGFLTFQPTESANFQPGQELGIRRNSGILGRITVDRLEGSQYIANVKANGYAGGIPDIVPGDEVIVVPPFYGVPGD